MQRWEGAPRFFMLELERTESGQVNTGPQECGQERVQGRASSVRHE